MSREKKLKMKHICPNITVIKNKVIFINLLLVFQIQKVYFLAVFTSKFLLYVVFYWRMN